MDSWRDVETGLDVLLSGSNACMKGPRLQEVCTALQQLIDSEDAGNSNVLSCVSCFIKTMQLLAKLLSARKRARDWKQQEYSSRVATVLAAATAVLEHPSILMNHVAAGKLGKRLLADTQVLPLVATAQQEVAQLLIAQVQQQPGAQQQQGQQGQGLLLHVADMLLLWWLGAHPLWGMSPARHTYVKGTTAAAAQWYYAYHMQTVELAAAVAQAAGPNCTTKQFLSIAEIVHRVAALQKCPDHHSTLQEAAVARYTSAAYLRLVLLLLLTHSYCCNSAAPPPLGAEPSGTSSTSGTSSCADSSTTTSVSAGGAAAGSGATGAALLQQQQLAVTLADLWQQLGMDAASLAVFADAMQADGDLQVTVLAAVESWSSGSSVSSGSTLFLPEDRPLMLRALGHMMHELHAMLLSMLNCPEWGVSALLGHRDSAAGRQHGGSGARGQQQQQQRALTRQQQQLLQAVCLKLPQVLLRTALLCGDGEPQLAAGAAAVSTQAVVCWHTACKPASDDANLQQEQALPGVFECWLQLMQQLLLQQPRDSQPAAPPAAVFAAAIKASANSDTAAQQHSSSDPQQQRQLRPSGLLLQIAATRRVLPGGSAAGQQLLDAALCSCAAAKDPAGDTSPSSPSSQLSCVALDCHSLLAVESLLDCLGVVQAERGGLSGRAAAVLLLLEVLARRVLPHHITCSKSSSSQRSSGAMRASVKLCAALHQHGLLKALFAASLSQPQQLQPRVVALVASLHKLTTSPHVVRHPQQRLYLSLLGATAAAARLTIWKLHKMGVCDAIGRDLRTWRHMMAPWLALIGRYCLRLGSWLSLWHAKQLEQQQQWEQWQQQLRQQLGGSSSNDSSGSDRLTPSAASAEVTGALCFLDEVQGLLDVEVMHKVRNLWETCSMDPESTEDDDKYSFSSDSGLNGDTSTGPEYARAWQQWQGAARQQPVPAYGSLAAEFDRLLDRRAVHVELLGLCRSLVQQAHKRIQALQQASSRERPSSSSDDGFDDSVNLTGACAFELLVEWGAAGEAINSASSASSALQACVGFSGFAALGSELQEIGAGLCAKLPLPWLCNNPLCSSMGGASELQLVGGRSCVCGGCRVARYCGVDCQAAHWEQHKPVCRELAAAAEPQAVPACS